MSPIKLIMSAETSVDRLSEQEEGSGDALFGLVVGYEIYKSILHFVPSASVCSLMAFNDVVFLCAKVCLVQERPQSAWL